MICPVEQWLLRQRQEAEEDPLAVATEVMVLTYRQAWSNPIVTYPMVNLMNQVDTKVFPVAQG